MFFQNCFNIFGDLLTIKMNRTNISINNRINILRKLPPTQIKLITFRIATLHVLFHAQDGQDGESRRKMRNARRSNIRRQLSDVSDKTRLCEGEEQRQETAVTK